MKKTIALITGIAFCLLVTPLALHAEDTSTPTGDNGGCQGGSCSGGAGGGKHHKHHDADKGDKPTPSPTPAQ
jgi:hypothetical protein